MLVPVRPDLVVDYEGGNQFWPVNFINKALPPRPKESDRRPSALERYSALAVRVHNAWNGLHAGGEPPKPALRVAWPADLDEQDPALDDLRLPVDLPNTLKAMDRMRAAVATYGGTLMPSSFVFLASPGLVLDRVRDAGAYRFLNETLWPFSYAHIRRYADFQNRVFRKYATVHELPFNDLASVYPADPRLFQDILHMTPAGIKLNINIIPSTQYWEIWNQTPFGITAWTHRPLGTMVLSVGYRTGVPWNESKYSNAEFDRLLAAT